MPRGSATVRVARWSATHPWRAIAMWLAVVAACFAIGSATGVNQMKDEDQNIGEVSRADKIVQSGHFADPDVENILITSPSGGKIDAAAANKAAADATARMKQLPDVASVAQPVTTPDGKAMIVRVDLTQSETDAADRVQPLLDATSAVQKQHPSLRVEEVGDGSITKALNETLGNDFK